jgi:hypothetical protein
MLKNIAAREEEAKKTGVETNWPAIEKSDHK